MNSFSPEMSETSHQQIRFHFPLLPAVPDFQIKIARRFIASADISTAFAAIFHTVDYFRPSGGTGSSLARRFCSPCGRTAAHVGQWVTFLALPSGPRGQNLRSAHVDVRLSVALNQDVSNYLDFVPHGPVQGVSLPYTCRELG